MPPSTSRPAAHPRGRGASKKAQQPRRKKGKTQKGKTQAPSRPAYNDTTDPKRVFRPVVELVHPSLDGVNFFNTSHPMCFIFDAVNPARQFKRGEVYDSDEDTPFPDYNPDPENDGEVTETDINDEPGLQPYNPIVPRCVVSTEYCQLLKLTLEMPLRKRYDYRVEISTQSFMHWRADELIDISYGKKVKKSNKNIFVMRWCNRGIPVPYARLLHQFYLEDRHSLSDAGHEARRRMAYARRVLDEFGMELERYKHLEKDFRSAVFTPILQRQLRGLPDSYTPAIHAYLLSPKGTVTIEDATMFYLANDPLDPDCIPTYRRNLIYIREALWHLLVVTGHITSTSRIDYNWVIETHDIIMDRLEARDEEDEGFPLFTSCEVDAIVACNIETWFAEELEEVVRTSMCLEYTDPDYIFM